MSGPRQKFKNMVGKFGGISTLIMCVKFQPPSFKTMRVDRGDRRTDRHFYQLEPYLEPDKFIIYQYQDNEESSLTNA